MELSEYLRSIQRRHWGFSAAESHAYGLLAGQVHPFHAADIMDAAADVTAACLLMEGLARIAQEQLLSLAQGEETLSGR